MMKKTRFLMQMLLITACSFVGMEATAQLVDRATFERALDEAWQQYGGRRAATTNDAVTLTQNPYEIEAVTINAGQSVEVKLYFNTAVMASYRSESCPRVTQFDLEMPTGITPIAISTGNDLIGSGINVKGSFGGNTMHFLGYGTLTAAQLAALPKGRIHYATITLQAASTVTTGNKTMTIKEALFCMADEPETFIIDGSTTVRLTVVQPVTSITISKTSATVAAGNTLQLSYSVTPSNATNKAATWSSSNTNIATVSSSGLVTAKAPGTATITVTTTDGSNLSASCIVTVTGSSYLQGDVDGNGHVDGTDLNILINIILGNDNAANYSGRANVNGEGGIDGNDLNKLINIILGKN